MKCEKEKAYEKKDKYSFGKMKLTKSVKINFKRIFLK